MRLGAARTPSASFAGESAGCTTAKGNEITGRVEAPGTPTHGPTEGRLPQTRLPQTRLTNRARWTAHPPYTAEP